MKKHFVILILFICILLPFQSFADLNGSGFYRVQNFAKRTGLDGISSQRYISMIHNQGSAGVSSQDLHSLFMVTDGNEITDPSTIIYLSKSGSKYDIQAMGTGLNSFLGYTASLTENASSNPSPKGKLYNAYIQVLIKVYLQDENGIDKASTGDSDDCRWYILPVDDGNGGDTFFGVAPTEADKVGDYYYTTLRTAFSYELSNNVRAFVVDNNGDKNQLKELTGEIPVNTGVILQCTSTDPSDNRIYPKTVGTKAYNKETTLAATALVSGKSYDYFKSSVVNAKAGETGSYTRGQEYGFGTANSSTTANYRVLSIKNGNLGFYDKFTEAYPSDLCLNGRLAYYNVAANDALGGLTLVETPTVTCTSAIVYTGETITFNASKQSNNSHIVLQYSTDGGDTWTETDGTIQLNSEIPIEGILMVRTSHIGTNCQIESDVVSLNYSFEARKITLAELLSGEDKTGYYDVTDLTAVAISSDDSKSVLYCKDNNGASVCEMSSSTVVDYVKDKVGLQQSDWDHSNWIALELSNSASSAVAQLLNKPLKNVKGKLINKTNPTMQLISTPEEDKAAGAGWAAVNNYITCNFYAQSEQTSIIDGNTYFFVTPRPMEVANIYWAMWNGSAFVVPPYVVGQSNQANLDGGFNADVSNLTPNHVYNFLGLITLAQTKATVSTTYLVYPLNELTDVGNVNGGVITGVTDIIKDGAVEVARYNVAGMPVDSNYRGVVIIVMSDGTARKTIVK